MHCNDASSHCDISSRKINWKAGTFKSFTIDVVVRHYRATGRNDCSKLPPYCRSKQYGVCIPPPFPAPRRGQICGVPKAYTNVYNQSIIMQILTGYSKWANARANIKLHVDFDRSNPNYLKHQNSEPNAAITTRNGFISSILRILNRTIAVCSRCDFEYIPYIN